MCRRVTRNIHHLHVLTKLSSYSIVFTLQAVLHENVTTTALTMGLNEAIQSRTMRLHIPGYSSDREHNKLTLPKFLSVETLSWVTVKA